MIKDLAALIGTTEDTVINWELRGVKPTLKCHRQKLVEFLGAESTMAESPRLGRYWLQSAPQPK